MKLVIGGYAQGKLRYILRREAIPEKLVFDGRLPDTEGECVVVNHLHELIREQLREGKDPEEAIDAFTAKNPSCILICDEIGNGIVPMDAFEREYRERTGRILIRLAEQAEEVVRVICGIGQRIK